jgi:hypothetical protein
MADDWFNVQSAQYGAAGNRTTDDTAAFGAALSAIAAAGGGTLYVPAGHYMLTADLVYPHGAPPTIVGDGPGAYGYLPGLLRDQAQRGLRSRLRKLYGCASTSSRVRSCSLPLPQPLAGWLQVMRPEGPLAPPTRDGSAVLPLRSRAPGL